MAAPLVVVLFVAIADASDPATRAMTVTTQEMLGPDAVVVVREVATPPTDEAADTLGKTLHAAAVVEVAWPDPDRRRARLHVHVRGATSWTDRELTFSAADPAPERGRTLALNVVGMVPSAPPEEPPAPAPPKPEAPPPPPAPGPAPATAVPITRPWLGLELLARASTWTGLSDAGGAVAFAVRPFSDVWLRAGFGVRTGELSEAPANASTLHLSLGGAWETRLGTHLMIGARLDALVLRQAIGVSALGAGARAHDARWVPGASLVIELAIVASEATAVVVGAGAEHAFGNTDIVVDGETHGSLPRTRFLGEIGLRARF